MARMISHSRARGVVLMEVAIVLMLLLLLTFGAMEYGWMFSKSGELANAAQQGARVGMRAHSTTAEVQAAVNELMDRAGLSGTGYSVAIDPADISLAETGDWITVTVSMPYNSVALTGFPLLPVPATLSETSVMAREGP